MSSDLTFVDEAVIDASPEKVFNAILDECAGLTHWWMPLYEIKPRADTPLRNTGMVSDVILRGMSTLRFSWTLTGLAEGRSIEVAYNGDFLATGEWVLEPVDGKTRVKYTWKGRPNKLLLSIGFMFMDTKKLHSDAIQHGFTGLNDYISKN
jgi:uncharacterized protein YndB with AHSA1/START domain